MTNSLFQDAVGIDTNVFEHLLNPQKNVGEHINSLLEHLQEQRIALLIDDSERISGEYSNRISPIIQRSDDLKNEVYILRYWILNAPRHSITIDLMDKLMMTIRGVIVEPSEVVDRMFVYVALSQGKILVSNDEVHIVCGPPNESRLSARRQRLLNHSRRLRPSGAEIFTSQEAHDRI